MLTPVKYNWLKAELASWEYKRRNSYSSLFYGKTRDL